MNCEHIITDKRWIAFVLFGAMLTAAGCNSSSMVRADAQTMGSMPTKKSNRMNSSSASGDSKAELGHVVAAENRVVTLDGLNMSEAVGLAIARHPDISRADAVVARSASEIAIAKADWFPTIQYGVQPGYGNSSYNQDNTAQTRGTIGVQQQIYDFGRTSSRISAANANWNKEKFLLADTTEQVAFDTSTIFVQLAASQDMLQSACRQVAALRAIRVRIAERARAGLSDASDLNQADVSIQRAEAELLKQQTQFDIAAGKLAELIGARPARVANLKTIGQQVARLGNGAAGVDQAPSLLAADAALQEADARMKLAKASRFPTVSLGLSQGLSTRKNSSDDNTWVGLSVNGDFSLGGKARHQISAAEADQRAAAQALENQRRNVRTAMNSARTEASGAYARAESYQKVSDLAQSSRDLFWQEYTLNKRPLTNVIDAESEIYQSELERSVAVADGILARIRSHVAIGEYVALLRKIEGKA